MRMCGIRVPVCVHTEARGQPLVFSLRHCPAPGWLAGKPEGPTCHHFHSTSIPSTPGFCSGIRTQVLVLAQQSLDQLNCLLSTQCNFLCKDREEHKLVFLLHASRLKNLFTPSFTIRKTIIEFINSCSEHVSSTYST